jgi:inorganic pyrophosphatase
MRIEAIAIGSNPPHDVNVIIEVPLGGQPIKYELDKDAGTLVVNRFLRAADRHPRHGGQPGCRRKDHRRPVAASDAAL